MTIKKSLLLWIFFLLATPPIDSTPLAKQFKQAGYVEIVDNRHGAEAFDLLYAYFDNLIEFLQVNPAWTQKLYTAKERFIRSRGKHYYSTDFFGFYDESKSKERHQVSFYYSSHFHEFLCFFYPQLNQIPEIIDFFEMCFTIQTSYLSLFHEAAEELGIETIFSSEHSSPPILFKVIKYLPSYTAARPHYDGSLFSLFLDSTDNAALLLSPYKSSFMVDDFASPIRKFSRGDSLLMIPGSLLTEFSIYPTPHIVLGVGKIRYATVAFAMKPNRTPEKIPFTSLPNFKH